MKMTTTYLGTLDSRGRVTVPSELRRRLSLSAGDRVDFVVEKKRIVLRFQHSHTNVSEEYKGMPETFPGGHGQIQVRIRRKRGK